MEPCAAAGTEMESRNLSPIDETLRDLIFIDAGTKVLDPENALCIIMIDLKTREKGIH